MNAITSSDDVFKTDSEPLAGEEDATLNISLSSKPQAVEEDQKFAVDIEAQGGVTDIAVKFSSVPDSSSSVGSSDGVNANSNQGADDKIKKDSRIKDMSYQSENARLATSKKDTCCKAPVNAHILQEYVGCPIHKKQDFLDCPAPLPLIRRPREPSLPGAFAIVQTRGYTPPPPFWRNQQNQHASRPNNHDCGGDDNSEAKSAEDELVEATPLSATEQVHQQVARPVADSLDPSHHNNTASNARFYGTILMALLVLVITAGAIGFVVGQQNKAHIVVPIPNTTSTTTTTTAAPTPAALLSFTERLPKTTLGVIQRQQGSPQARAYEWIVQDPNLDQLSEDRLLQRFAAATFYYATQGESWTHQGGNRTVQLEVGVPGTVYSIVNVTREAWLSHGTNECDWLSFPMGGPGSISDAELCGDGQHESFQNLILFANNLNGTIPNEIGLWSNMRQVHLYRNEALGGTLPTTLGNLEELGYWSSRACGLRGSIPSQVGRLWSTLRYFNSFKNQHTGTLPAELWDMPRLEAFRVGRNRLQGTIPNTVRLPKLQMLRLARNQMEGTIPASLGDSTQLDELDLASNQFTGTLPSELGRLVNLTELELGENLLSGTVPSEFGLLTNLVSFGLEKNVHIRGRLPPELGLLNGSLAVLSIEGSDLSGTIPDELCGIESLSFDCSEILCGCGCPCPGIRTRY